MRQLKITKSITNRESASLDKYLQEIGREDLITVEEEVELAQRIRKGDRIALEKLTRANLRFVVSVAKQYQNQGLSLPDLINEGGGDSLRGARHGPVARSRSGGPHQRRAAYQQLPDLPERLQRTLFHVHLLARLHARSPAQGSRRICGPQSPFWADAGADSMIIASKHFPRIITGAVLVSVLGTALYLSGPYLFGLLLLFTLVGLWEFYAMFWPLKANIGGRILGLALGGLLITAAWMRPEMVVMTLALSTLILACMFLFCWSHDDKYRFTRVAVLAGGLLYVPMLIMPALNFSIHEQLLLICTAAGSDTAGTADATASAGRTEAATAGI